MSFITNYSTGLAPFPRLSATPHSSQLNSHLHLHLAAYDDTYWLEKFIQLASRCSNRIQSCSTDSSVAIATPPICQLETSDPPEPMQTDYNRLSSVERQMTFQWFVSVLWCEWAQDPGVPPSSSSGFGEYHTS